MIVILIALIFGMIVIYQSARSSDSETKGRQRADSGFFGFSDGDSRHDGCGSDGGFADSGCDGGGGGGD